MKLIPVRRFLPARLRSPRGFTLIATIMILALLVVLLVGAFTTTTTELSVSRSHYNDYRATLALESAFQAATRKAFHQMERTEDFVVFRRHQSGVAAPHLRPVVYYSAVYDGATSQWRYQPLISGARTDLTTTTLERQPGGTALRASVIAAGPGVVDATGFPIVPGTGNGGWTDTPLLPAWEMLDFRPSGLSGADPEVMPDLTASPLDRRAKGQDMQVRYCYWIEDLAGRLDGDLAGNTEGANLTHLRGQPAEIKDLPRQLALFTLLPPTPGTPGLTFPNVDSAISSTQDNFLINRRQYLLTNETATQIGLNSAPLETMLKKALTFGMPQWYGREMIPHKPSIAQAKRGSPKLDINNLIRRAESDTSADGSGERNAAITELAEHIKAALPQFAFTRAGGNVNNTSLNTAYQGTPQGKLMTTDEYVFSLAASIIDYADRDQTPSVDPQWVRSTTTSGYGPGDTNVPKYRGIDGQPFCVGYATRFLNSDWTNTSVTMQVSVWVALWNPTDREIEGDLSVRFTEGRTVLNCMLQGENIAGGSRPVLPHLNLPVKHISLGPNEFMHVPWYDIHTMTATGLTAARVNNPQFRMCPDDAAGIQSLFDAGFQIFWNGKLADRTRRPDNINRPYRQPGSTNDKAALGRWFFACSGIGDSSLPASDPRGTLYSAGLTPRTSTPDDSGNRGYYYREARYINNCFWGGGAAKSTFGDSYDPSLWTSDPGHPTATGSFNTAPLETETPDIHLQNRAVASPPLPEKAPSHVKHPVDDYPPDYNGPGYYESLGELGLIFDPSAWTRMQGGGSRSFQGGGRTLRIGSPELSPFDITPGSRASDLLDILCLGETRPMKGLVNINSVRPEVARTLFAGMELRSERAIEGGVETAADGIRRNAGAAGAIYPPSSDISTDAASVFATAVTAPNALVSASAADFSLLQYTPVIGFPSNERPYYFGDVRAWTHGTTTHSPRPHVDGAEPGLDDRGREEMFRKVLPLVTFHSRTFRMYLTAQVLDKQGDLVGTRSKMYDLLLEPVRDSTGAIISQEVKIIYEKNL